MKYNKIIMVLLLAAVTACGRSSGSKQQITSKGVEDLLLPEKTVAPAEKTTVQADKTPAQARPEAVKTHMFHPELADMDEDYNYYYFGKIGYNVKAFREDSLCFPPIRGLVHESVFAMCPADTCFAQYAVLALRCPPVQPLLKWVADTVDHFVQECPVGGHLKTRQGKGKGCAAGQFKSDREILDKYIYQLRHVYDGWHCPGERDHAYVNEQEGLLLADCWHNGNLYTFYRLIWYDFLSCGDNVRVSYYTVDSASGRRLGLSDFILPGKQEALADLIAPRLLNGKGTYYLDRLRKKPDNNDILRRADGCALIADGLIIYYYPYNLSYGADSQFEAVIPYDELDGILKPGVVE